MDIQRAMVEISGLDRVRICAMPWTIDARVHVVNGRPVLVDVRIQNADGITAGRLTELPIRHITMLAASAVWGPEETIYRLMATPLGDGGRPGSRSWPTDHYQRVARVAEWAKRSARPGGPAACVAEFWGVHVRTSRRWLARVAELAHAAGE